MAVKTITKDQINQFVADIERQIMQVFEDVAPDVVKEIQLVTPVRTGTLKASVAFEVEDRSVGFGSDVDYARYVQWGTVNQRPQRNFDRGLDNAIPEIKSALSRVK